MGTNVVAGLYKHYTGTVYNVLGVGTDTETLGKVVVYTTTEGSFRIWTTPLKQFCSHVSKDGHQVRQYEPYLKSKETE